MAGAPERACEVWRLSPNSLPGWVLEGGARDGQKLGEQVSGRGQGQGRPGGDGTGGETRRGGGQPGAWEWEQRGTYWGSWGFVWGPGGRRRCFPACPSFQKVVCSGPLDLLLLLLLPRRFRKGPQLPRPCLSPCRAGPDRSAAPAAPGRCPGQGGTQLWPANTAHFTGARMCALAPESPLGVWGEV